MSRTPGGRELAREWLPWAGIAAAAGIAALAGSYLAVGRDPAFVVTPIDALVVALTPDRVVAFAINELQDLGHVLAAGVSLLVTAAILGAAALPAARAMRDGRRLSAVLLGIGLPGLAAVAILLGTGAADVTVRTVYSAVGAGLGAGLAVLVAALAPRVVDGSEGRLASPARRQVLGAVGAAAGVGALGFLTRGGGDATPDFVGIPEDADPEVRELLTQARDRSMDVDGLEPLVSTSFFEVDINTVANPRVDASDWTLDVTGAVGSEVTLDMDDLRELPFERRFVTLRCVGDYLNGDKLDNALWGGVPLAPILEMVEPQGEFVMLRAVDAYFNEFPIEALRPGLLAYRMNGRPLPQAHGAPVRALVPGHWGEVNVKWLDEIEVLDEPARGYWEQRGWNGTGPVNTVAKLWQTNRLGSGRVEVAGHAYAGTRGIRAVEVSTDGGDTWSEAELSEPLPGNDVWRQWRHSYVETGTHEVVVRAIDGTGALQIPDQNDPLPSGATGWVSKEISPL